MPGLPPAGDPKTGEHVTYISLAKIRQSNDAGNEVQRLKAAGQVRTMDCTDGHNRVGHSVPSVSKAVDESMVAGAIDPSLPYVKRSAVALLTRPYASAEAAQTAINGLGVQYAQAYPSVATAKAKEISAASQELNKLYSLIATPHMTTGDMTYADNLGHQNAPDCFRCHDGAHFKVVGNQVTKDAIPSTCNTCHTFPQIASGNFIPQGATQFGPTSAVPVGEKPADHNDTLWVFNHRNVAGGVNPTGTSCGSCHTPSYCSTCHDSGAIKVDHDQMLCNHAQSVRDVGATTACEVCHQPSYCDQCHQGDILGPTNSHLDKPGG